MSTIGVDMTDAANTAVHKAVPKLPTSFATMARYMIAQPTTTPTHSTREFRGENWVCLITGRVGQRHIDLIEACMKTHRGARFNGIDKTIDLLIDPHKLRVALGYFSKTTGKVEKLASEQLRVLFRDLQGVVVEIENELTRKHGLPELEPLIRGLKNSGTRVKNKLPGSTDRPLMILSLGSFLSMFIQHDIKLHYDPAPIIEMRHGITKAVARHALTHSIVPNGGWRLETLIRAVAGEDVDSKTMCKYRATVKSSVRSLAAAGVLLDGDRVTLKSRAAELDPAIDAA